jgi:hypothetical protein
VGILGWIEGREQNAHLVTPEALSGRRSQQTGRRVWGHELGVGCELVAGVAIELLFVRQRLQVGWIEPRRHSAQSDLYVVGKVAALLGTGTVCRLKPVGRPRMASEARHVLQWGRVGVEVSAMSRRGRDALPRVLGRTRHMAVLAHLPGHLGMRWNSVRPREHPTHECLGLIPDVEGMAGVTRQRVVFPFRLIDQQVRPGVRVYK